MAASEHTTMQQVNLYNTCATLHRGTVWRAALSDAAIPAFFIVVARTPAQILYMVKLQRTACHWGTESGRDNLWWSWL